jgi:metallo-beta-lactamase class B
MIFRFLLLTICIALATDANAQAGRGADTSSICDNCDEWNLPQKPFRVYGNTYYVGVRGLASVLIASKRGLVLLDGDLAQSAPLIEANIRALGFRIEDVKLIVNSHAHFDHAGGIAALQRDSGAQVAASVSSAAALKAGNAVADDPQYAFGSNANGFPNVANVTIVRDGETLRVGDIALTAHTTPGHTPGSTTWTWRSCEQQRCQNVVYADSLNPISAPGFRFLGDATHGDISARFEASIDKVRKLPCEVLLTVHPGFSATLEKLERREKKSAGNPFVDKNACRAYADDAARRLRKRLDEERASAASSGR